MCRLIRHLLRCVRWGLFLPLLVLLAPVTSSASEMQQGTYTVTAAELQQLEGNLTRLRQINDSLTQELGAQKNKAVDLQTTLAEAQEQLTEARRRQTALQVELANLKSLSERQAESLQTANESLKTFAAAEKARRLRIKAQRNAWVTAAGLLAVGVALK